MQNMIEPVDPDLLVLRTPSLGQSLDRFEAIQDLRLTTDLVQDGVALQSIQLFSLSTNFSEKKFDSKADEKRVWET